MTNQCPVKLLQSVDEHLIQSQKAYEELCPKKQSSLIPPVL
ncbi:hypothetical protein EP7_004286 [Isosphaeraceae bacterium EP7]